MSRLEEALERLERAVARLEAACRAGAGGAESEADNRRLREAVDEIATHVDQALAKVGQVLKGEA
jgi:phage shock protein A